MQDFHCGFKSCSGNIHQSRKTSAREWFFLSCINIPANGHYAMSSAPTSQWLEAAVARYVIVTTGLSERKICILTLEKYLNLQRCHVISIRRYLPGIRPQTFYNGAKINGRDLKLVLKMFQHYSMWRGLAIWKNWALHLGSRMSWAMWWWFWGKIGQLKTAFRALQNIN